MTLEQTAPMPPGVGAQARVSTDIPSSEFAGLGPARRRRLAARKIPSLQVGMRYGGWCA
jgi:hypothetical protein